MMTLLGLSTSTSCVKEECEDPIEIKTDIHQYERTIIVRFNVPKEKGDTRVVISGTLYGYDADDNGILPNPQIKSFTVSDTGVSGHYQENTQSTRNLGEPVPGAEILVEQEPNDEPGTITTTDIDNASFTINRVFSPGTYQIRVKLSSGANSSKGGFAIGGFSAA